MDSVFMLFVLAVVIVATVYAVVGLGEAKHFIDSVKEDYDNE